MVRIPICEMWIFQVSSESGHPVEMVREKNYKFRWVAAYRGQMFPSFLTCCYSLVSAFRLSAFRQPLLDWLEASPDVIVPASRRNEVMHAVRYTRSGESWRAGGRGAGSFGGCLNARRVCWGLSYRSRPRNAGAVAARARSVGRPLHLEARGASALVTASAGCVPVRVRLFH